MVIYRCPLKNGVAVPFNVMTPAEREALMRAGVEIAPPSKKAGKDCRAAYEAWKKGGSPDGPQGVRRYSLSIEEIEKDNTDFNHDLDLYVKGGMKRSDVITIKNHGVSMGYLPNSKDIILRQSVINKAIKKHNISAESLQDMPGKLHDPIVAFKSTRDDVNAVVALVDGTDKDGNNIVVAVNLDGSFNGLEVNDITSMYGKDSYEGYSKWANNIIAGNEEKLKAWIESLPENDIRGVSKSILSGLQEKLHEVVSAHKGTTDVSDVQGNQVKYSLGEESQRLFDAAKRKFGETKDIREAGKEKTGTKTRGTGQDALTPSQSPVSRYKVKELIHSSQENDKKLLGIGDSDTLFSLGGEMDGWQSVQVS